MASLMRPSIVRQSCLSLTSRRFLSTNSSATPAFRQPITPSTLFKSPVILRQAFVRNALPGATRVAAFHATGRRAILPPEPQRIEGTTNDAQPLPHPSPTHGSYHWTFERLMSAALIPLTIAPFAGGSLNPAMDAVLCSVLLIHSHVGFQALIIDYLPNKRVPKTRALFWWGLRLATLTVGVGLYEFETNDVGLTEAIKRIWKA